MISDSEKESLAVSRPNNRNGAPSLNFQGAFTGHRQHMRTRLLDFGPAGFSDREFLELLLHSSMPQRDSSIVAQLLLKRFGSFGDAVTASLTELRAVDGLSEGGIVALKLARASAIRLARAEMMARPLLNSAETLIAYLGSMLSHEKLECIHVLFLDTRNRLISDETQAFGTVNHTPVYPREILKRALELHATALILVHNHPSGDPFPSVEDMVMTENMKQAAGILGIHLHDHIVVGRGAFFSFREEGLLSGHNCDQMASE